MQAKLGRYSLTTVALVATGLLATVAGAQDAEEKKLGWFDVAELNYVQASGNAEAETLGFRNSLRRVWEESEFRLEAGGLRAESSTIDRFATGSVDDFRQVERSTSDLTAENYFLRLRYDRSLGERLFAFGGLGWERNEFAGIENRYTAIAGVGHVWFDSETSRFRTDYGLSYTDEQDVVDNPDGDDGFVGVRLGWDYWRLLSNSSEFGSLLLVDTNFDESSDYRADFINWVSVTMTERLALKVSLQMLYDAEPALAELALVDDAGDPTGLTVLGQLDDLDTLLTTALVINF